MYLESNFKSERPIVYFTEEDYNIEQDANIILTVYFDWLSYFLNEEVFSDLIVLIRGSQVNMLLHF